MKSIKVLAVVLLLEQTACFQFMSKFKAPMTEKEIADKNALKEKFGDKSKFGVMNLK